MTVQATNLSIVIPHSDCSAVVVVVVVFEPFLLSAVSSGGCCLGVVWIGEDVVETVDPVRRCSSDQIDADDLVCVPAGDRVCLGVV